VFAALDARTETPFERDCRKDDAGRDREAVQTPGGKRLPKGGDAMRLLLALSLIVLCGCSDLVTAAPQLQLAPDVRIKVNHFRDGVAPDTIVFFGRVFNDGPADTLRYQLNVVDDSAMLVERDGFFVENQFQAALAYDPAAGLVFSCAAWTATDTSVAVFSTR
jgi:hypothetical protein